MSADVPAPIADGPLTDAYLHLWDPRLSPYRWMGSTPQLRRAGTWQAVGPALVGLGAARVVLVQADDTASDTAHLLRTAESIEAGTAGADDPRADGSDATAVPPLRADVVAWMPLEHPQQVEDLLGEGRFLHRVVGVRHLVHDEPDAGFLERPRATASLRMIARAGLALDVPDAFARHMDQVARLADTHPDLIVVLDHLGKPPLGDDGAMDRWERALAEIARRENTVAKLSGLATSGDGGPGGIGRAVTMALEHFGPRRLMFGSDWPIAPQPFDLSSGTGALLERIGAESAADRAEMLHRTAARVYSRVAGTGAPSPA